MFVLAEQVVFIVLYVFCDREYLEKKDTVELAMNISGAVVLKIATGLVFIILILHYTTQCVLIIFASSRN